MEEKIKSIFLELGADICGIAKIERFADAPAGFHPRDVYPDCRSVIAYGVVMPKGLLEVNPRITYIHATDLIINKLDQIALQASVRIEQLGGIAVPVPSDSPYEYWDGEKLEGRGLLSMKHAAWLAGLGSMGKNTLLVNKKYGNRINVGVVLTNLELDSDPITEKFCIDNCSLCIDSCPQKALDGTTADQRLCRTHTYGTNSRGFSICCCNTCRVVCPLSYGEIV